MLFASHVGVSEASLRGKRDVCLLLISSSLARKLTWISLYMSAAFEHFRLHLPQYTIPVYRMVRLIHHHVLQISEDSVATSHSFVLLP